MAGGGIILQPSFIVGAELVRGTLVPLLTDYRTLELSLFAVYLSRRQLSSKVRVFIDYLVAAVGEQPPWERWQQSKPGAAKGSVKRSRRRTSIAG